MIALLLSLFLLAGPTVPADAPFGSVQSAFKSGNASSLASLCKDKCLINILEEERVYSKSQATQVLKSFFTIFKRRRHSFTHNIRPLNIFEPDMIFKFIDPIIPKPFFRVSLNKFINKISSLY